jgi:hypothetical protein
MPRSMLNMPAGSVRCPCDKRYHVTFYGKMRTYLLHQRGGQKRRGGRRDWGAVVKREKVSLQSAGTCRPETAHELLRSQ